MSNPSAILDDQYTPPLLNYIGAVDITCAQFGTTMYSVFYDSNISTLGNVLMFEYKLIKESVNAPTPTTVSFGFVSIENAINAGISNQWTIAIPAQDDLYSQVDSVRIAVRVYVGRSVSAEVAVTPWSNELDVHNPPPEPVIVEAFYDAPSANNDDLFVFLQKDPAYDSSINFVVAFYYQDSSNNTVWDVSAPLPATIIDSSFDPSENTVLMIQVPEFGLVSTDPSYNVVYTAVYAVYSFKDASDNNFYTVSHVSNTWNAYPTTYANKPVITSINYAVYTTAPAVPGSQIMTVNWSDPSASIVPIYNVAYYNFYHTINVDASGVPVYWILDASGNFKSYNYDASSLLCGQTIHFRVEAVSANGTISPPSDNTVYSQLNKFIYSTAPQNLSIDLAEWDATNSTVDLTISFENPSDIGCGSGLYYQIYVNDVAQLEPTDIPYDASAAFYSYPFTDAPFLQSGTVKVALFTRDTNPVDPGATPLVYPDSEGIRSEKPYIATNIFLNPVDYQVYVNRSQNMNLSWNSQKNGAWNQASYALYYIYSVDGSANSPVLQGTYDTVSTVFDASFADCGDSFEFYVVCTLTQTGAGSDPSANKVVTSETQFINIFKYSDAPVVNVLWSSSDIDNSFMDIKAIFSYPDKGCGAFVKFVANVRDPSNNILDTKDVTNDASSYAVNFNDVPYRATGTVEVYMVTQDTNSSLQLNGASGIGSFITARVPIIRDVVLTANTLTFDVVTQGDLDLQGWALAYDSNNYMVFDTVSSSAYYIVTSVEGANFETIYTITVQPGLIYLTNFPNQMAIVASNSIGMGHSPAYYLE